MTRDAVAVATQPIPAGRRVSLRRLLRILGTTAMLAGALLLLWAFVVWKWNDPFTGFYTRYEQGRLAKQYQGLVQAYRAHETPLGPALPSTTPVAHAASGRTRPTRAQVIAAERKTIATEGARYRDSTTEGEAIGRITVPRLGLNMILVDGTDEASLERGPGRSLQTYMPGEGQLVYIAGHRTTFLAPFAHIDGLRKGDTITISVPYGTFHYRVFAHVIVPADDLARLRSHGRDVVALQACHPRFFATERYIVYGRLVSVVPDRGKAFSSPS